MTYPINTFNRLPQAQRTCSTQQGGTCKDPAATSTNSCPAGNCHSQLDAAAFNTTGSIPVNYGNVFNQTDMATGLNKETLARIAQTVLKAVASLQTQEAQAQQVIQQDFPGLSTSAQDALARQAAQQIFSQQA